MRTPSMNQNPNRPMAQGGVFATTALACIPWTKIGAVREGNAPHPINCSIIFALIVMYWSWEFVQGVISGWNPSITACQALERLVIDSLFCGSTATLERVTEESFLLVQSKEFVLSIQHLTMYTWASELNKY